MDQGVPQPSRSVGRSSRRRGLRIASCLLLAVGTAAIVSVVSGQGPAGLVAPQGGRSRPQRALEPDLVAGHLGWCRYGRTQGSGGSCVSLAEPRAIVPASSRAAVCGFEPLRVSGLVAEWGQSLASVPPAVRLGSRGGLLSCASNWYSINGDVLLASLLIDPDRPGGHASGIPGLYRRDGVMELPAAELSARRVRVGWLVVRGAPPPLRAMLLRRLRVKATRRLAQAATL